MEVFWGPLGCLLGFEEAPRSPGEVPGGPQSPEEVPTGDVLRASWAALGRLGRNLGRLGDILGLNTTKIKMKSLQKWLPMLTSFFDRCFFIDVCFKTRYPKPTQLFNFYWKIGRANGPKRVRSSGLSCCYNYLSTFILV